MGTEKNLKASDVSFTAWGDITSYWNGAEVADRIISPESKKCFSLSIVFPNAAPLNVWERAKNIYLNKWQGDFSTHPPFKSKLFSASFQDRNFVSLKMCFWFWEKGEKHLELCKNLQSCSHYNKLYVGLLLSFQNGWLMVKSLIKRKSTIVKKLQMNLI